MSEERTILLATRNPAKDRKLRWLLDGLGLAFSTPDAYPEAVEPDERGETHEDVARQKAVFWSGRAAGLAIASDGGARIPALGDAWDSRFTRRAAGPDVDDRARAEHLLGLMRGRPEAERDVVWVEGLALAQAGEPLASWEVQARLGRLVEQYDPALIVGGFWMWGLIQVPGFGKVYARLTPDEVAQIDDCWNTLRAHLHDWLADHPL